MRPGRKKEVTMRESPGKERVSITVPGGRSAGECQEYKNCSLKEFVLVLFSGFTTTTIQRKKKNYAIPIQLKKEKLRHSDFKYKL